MSLCKYDKIGQVDILDRISQTLRGSSSLNMHGILKRVIYSESVNKMLQYGIKKNPMFPTVCFWPYIILPNFEGLQLP